MLEIFIKSLKHIIYIIDYSYLITIGSLLRRILKICMDRSFYFYYYLLYSEIIKCTYFYYRRSEIEIRGIGLFRKKKVKEGTLLAHKGGI
jgi:hypothetical protein